MDIARKSDAPMRSAIVWLTPARLASTPNTSIVGNALRRGEPSPFATFFQAHFYNKSMMAPAIAGLSLSRFAEVFLAMVGETPAAYLRKWRLTLARQDVAKGDRINAIARRYGYRSPEGFARAFKNQFGENPMMRRPSQQIQLASDRS